MFVINNFYNHFKCCLLHYIQIIINEFNNYKFIIIIKMLKLISKNYFNNSIF